MTRRVLPRWGLDLVPVRNSPDLVTALHRLKRQGLTISTVFDVGAFDGSWAADLARALPGRPQFVLFEPNERHVPALECTGFRHFTTLVGDHNGEMPFYSLGGTGDSVYLETTGVYDEVQPTMLPVRTLDALVAEHGLPIPQLLKIDTQGAELAVLRGASGMLPSVDLVYLEAPVLAYNAGAPTFDDYVRALVGFGFLPYAMLESHHHGHVLAQVDMLFVSTAAFARLFGPASLAAAQRIARL